MKKTDVAARCLEVGDEVAIKIVRPNYGIEEKGAAVLEATFMPMDGLAQHERTVRIFRSNKPLSSIDKATAGSKWLCRILKIDPVNPDRKTRDNRVFVNIHVELVERDVVESLYVEDDMLVKEKRCGDQVETTRYAVTVANTWFKMLGAKGEELAVPGKLILGKKSGDLLAFSADRHLAVDRLQFIQRELEGFERIISAKSVSLRFDRLDFIPNWRAPEVSMGFNSNRFLRRYAAAA